MANKTNQHNSICLGTLSYIVSFEAFFIFLIFFWYIMASNYGFCVCIFFFKKSLFFLVFICLFSFGLVCFGIRWVETWRGSESGDEWGRRNCDHNTLHKNLFSLKIAKKKGKQRRIKTGGIASQFKVCFFFSLIPLKHLEETVTVEKAHLSPHNTQGQTRRCKPF